MAKTHDWVYSDSLRFTAWDKTGRQTADSSSQQPARRDRVGIPSGPNGDFKTPNSFAMTAAYSEAPKGMQVQHNADGSGWKQEGVVGSESVCNLFTSIPTGVYEDVYNNALEKLNEKVRGSLDLSVDAAQFSQTARMFNLLRSVRSVTRGLHRNDGIWNGSKRTDPRVVITLPSGVYLNWTYGWKPTLQSIYDTAITMVELSEDRGVSFRARHKYEEELQPKSDVSLFSSTRATLIPKGKMQCRGEFKVWLKAPTGTTDLSRFTSLNPIAIGYELIPYSFVVDWFWNLGGYIRNVETAMLYNRIFRTGYYTYSTKVEGEYATAGPTQFGTRTCAASGRFKSVYLNRQRLSSYPMPHIPVLNLDLGSSQLFSASALLGSKLKILK